MAILCFGSGIFGVSLLLTMLICYANALVAPRAFFGTRAPCLNAMPPSLAGMAASSITLSGAEALPEMEPAALTPSELNDAAAFVDQIDLVLVGLRSIAIGTIVVVALLVAISVFVANVIIPQAAQQLEVQVKEKYPDLWREYEAKLEPGEVLAMRPDLIQELGNKMQQADFKEFERMKQQVQNAKDKNENVVDVEVISKEPNDDVLKS
jgi:hypothetical protein